MTLHDLVPGTPLAVPVDTLDHVLGPATAHHVVLEYGDYECPHCKRAQPLLRTLLERHGHGLRFVFRHFPLLDKHPHALLAAEAAEAAAAQGRFWPMHERLLEHPHRLDLPALMAHARALGLDVTRFEAELEDHVYLQRVQEHLASGRQSQVAGTPTFFVDGHRLEVKDDSLQPLLDAVARRVPAVQGE